MNARINLLRYWMRSLGSRGGIDGASWSTILRQLRDASPRRDGHALRIDHAGHCLREYRGAIFWEKGDSADPADLDEGAPAPQDGGRIANGRATRSGAWPQWRGTFVFEACDARRSDADRRRGKLLRSRRTLRAFARGRRTRATRRRCTEPYAEESVSGARRAGMETRRAAAVRRRDAVVRPADRRESRSARRAVDAATSRYRRIAWRADLLIA